MRTPTDSPASRFQAVDPQLVQHVFSPVEQRSLRLLAALMLAAYAILLPGLYYQQPWMGLLLPCLYGLLQIILSVIEMQQGTRAWRSGLITGLDLALLAGSIFNDPIWSLPTLLLTVLVIGLAGMRHSPRGLLIASLLATLVAATATGLRGFLESGYPIDTAGTAVATALLIGLVLLFRQHSRALRLRVERTIADDPATGLGNRWTLYAAAQMLWPLAHRQQLPVTLMYVVIEPTGLKKGQDADLALADRLVAEFAEVARGRLRGSDVLVRYSALECVFMLLDCPSSQAEPIALHLQEQFHRWSRDAGVPATAHIGATWLPAQPLALDLMLASMDEALHRARQHRLGVSGAVYADPEHTRNHASLS